MNTKNNPFILNDTTKNFHALVISPENLNHEILSYLENIFKSMTTFNNNEKEICDYYENNTIDILFVDISFTNFDIFKLIEKLQDINPKQIIISISDISNEDLLLKVLRNRINDFLLKPISLIDIKDSIIRNIDCLEESCGNLNAYESIQYLQENFLPKIQLINNYKGIPLIREATIVDCVDNLVAIKIADIQKQAINHLGHAIISSDYLGKDIYASLKEINHEKNIAFFDELYFLESYVHHRKQIRIFPDKNFSLMITNGINKFNYEVIDMNINHLLIKLEDDKSDFHLNHEYKIKIYLKSSSHISKNTLQDYTLTTTATVSEIFDINDEYKKVLLYFKLEKNENSIYQSYINLRTKSLIEEFKKTMKESKD